MSVVVAVATHRVRGVIVGFFLWPETGKSKDDDGEMKYHQKLQSMPGQGLDSPGRAGGWEFWVLKFSLRKISCRLRHVMKSIVE